VIFITNEDYLLNIKQDSIETKEVIYKTDITIFDKTDDSILKMGSYYKAN